MKVVAIVQARMGSTRLPGKVLTEVLGRPLLEYQWQRLKMSQLIDEVRIATSTAPQDDAIVRFCEERGIPCSRGSENDVLARFDVAAREAQADVIVRLTADCPVIDARVIDRAIQAYLDSDPRCDYVSNCLERTYPRGMDCEVFSADLLALMMREAKEPMEREHVTPFVYRRPERFRLLNVSYTSDQHRHRWTVDTPEDFELIQNLIKSLFPSQGFSFTLEELLRTIEENPGWELLNAHIEQKKL